MAWVQTWHTVEYFAYKFQFYLPSSLCSWGTFDPSEKEEWVTRDRFSKSLPSTFSDQPIDISFSEIREDILLLFQTRLASDSFGPVVWDDAHPPKFTCDSNGWCLQLLSRRQIPTQVNQSGQIQLLLGTGAPRAASGPSRSTKSDEEVRLVRTGKSFPSFCFLKIESKKLPPPLRESLFRCDQTWQPLPRGLSPCIPQLWSSAWAKSQSPLGTF